LKPITHVDEAAGNQVSRYESRYTEIIDTAAVVFAAQGYDATSIEDLIKATHLQRGGLYHYIGSKMDLLVGIHDCAMKRLTKQVEEIFETVDDPEMALRRYASVLLGSFEEFFPHVTVILREWRAIQNHPEWPRLRAERRYVEDCIADSIAKGVQTGRFKSVDARLASLGLIGMVNYSHEWLQLSGPLPLADIADTFVDIFLNGLCVRRN
jgi:AcrR family transcriptional regulator